jgi:hypothetical protein
MTFEHSRAPGRRREPHRTEVVSEAAVVYFVDYGTRPPVNVGDPHVFL